MDGDDDVESNCCADMQKPVVACQSLRNLESLKNAGGYQRA